MRSFEMFKHEHKTRSFNQFLAHVVRAKWPTPSEKEWWYTKLNAVRRTKLLRLSESQNHRCCYCGNKCWHPAFGEVGKKRYMATLEHIRARAVGGTDHMSNLAMACKMCNNLRDRYDAMLYASVAAQGGDITGNFHKAINRRKKPKKSRLNDPKFIGRYNAYALKLAYVINSLPYFSASFDYYLEKYSQQNSDKCV